MPPGWPTAVVLALLGCSLAGCFGGNKNVNARCDDPSEYQASRNLPGITVPEGLVAPSQATTFDIPPGTEGVAVKGAACLARPPPFFRPEPAAQSQP